MCEQSEILLRLAALSRHEFKKFFDFSINNQDNRSSNRLPLAPYKPEDGEKSCRKYRIKFDYNKKSGQIFLPSGDLMKVLGFDDCKKKVLCSAKA